MWYLFVGYSKAPNESNVSKRFETDRQRVCKRENKNINDEVIGGFYE